MRQEKHSKNRGFTLVELIVVLAVIAILAGIGVPTLLGYIDKGRARACEANLRAEVTAYQTMLAQRNIEGVSYTLSDFVAQENPSCPSSKQTYQAADSATLVCPVHNTTADTSGGGSVHVDVTAAPISQPPSASATPVPSSAPVVTPEITEAPTPTPEPSGTPVPSVTPEATPVVTPTSAPSNGNMPIYNVKYDLPTVDDIISMIKNGEISGTKDSKGNTRIKTNDLPAVFVYNNTVYMVKYSGETDSINLSDITAEGFMDAVNKLNKWFENLGTIKEDSSAGLYKDDKLVPVYNADILKQSESSYDLDWNRKQAYGKIILYNGKYYVCRDNNVKFSDIVNVSDTNSSWAEIGSVNASEDTSSYTGYVGTAEVRASDLDSLLKADGTKGSWSKKTLTAGEVISYTTTNGQTAFYIYNSDEDLSVYAFDLQYNKTAVDELITGKNSSFVSFAGFENVENKKMKKGTVVKSGSDYYLVLKDNANPTKDLLSDTAKFRKLVFAQ